ncbi:TPA: DsbE family thiol:disulfide interchange protein, partial [Mannheimia haemolytica]|nr:DsbE family thiol:disulfide interchange protein [Mannheimia haemolytica]
MNKKFLLPLILFLALSVAFLVQLARNSQGDDPKKLESALIGKTVPSFNLESVL